MNHNFTLSSLEISLSRLSDGNIVLSISSDYSRSDRKSRLYVNESSLANEVEYLWKRIKTKKLLKISVSFYEIDWYDNLTNIYETPIVKIERGQKKSRVSYSEHGSIPKEWGICLYALISDTSTNSAVLEVVRETLGSMFTDTMEKELKKKLKPFLQKKEKYATAYSGE